MKRHDMVFVFFGGNALLLTLPKDVLGFLGDYKMERLTSTSDKLVVVFIWFN